MSGNIIVEGRKGGKGREEEGDVARREGHSFRSSSFKVQKLEKGEGVKRKAKEAVTKEEGKMEGRETEGAGREGRGCRQNGGNRRMQEE